MSSSSFRATHEFMCKKRNLPSVNWTRSGLTYVDFPDLLCLRNGQQILKDYIAMKGMQDVATSLPSTEQSRFIQLLRSSQKDK